jgi:acyl carrier protein
MNEATIYATLTEVFHSVFFDKSIALRPEMTADDVTGWDKEF